MSAEDRAAVFSHDFVAYPVQAIFDGSPMIACQRQESLGIGLFARERRDEAHDLGRRFISDRPLTRDLTNLLGAGPIEVAVQAGGAD